MRTFPKMWRNSIDLDGFRANQTYACLLIAIHPAFPGTKITITQMRVSLRSLLGRVNGRNQLVLRNIVVEQERRGEVQRATCGRDTRQGPFHGGPKPVQQRHDVQLSCNI